MNYYFAAFIIFNVFAFVLMLVDKAKAVRGSQERLSEGLLFFLATVFGAVGVYAGMFTCRHKTRTWYFLIGIPLLIIENLALLYCLYLFFSPEAGIISFSF